MKNKNILPDILRKKIKFTKSCWLWTGGTDLKGYGKVQINKKTIGVHRLVFSIYCGDIPSGLFVCHTCINPNCVNPKHLFIGTPKDNMRDIGLAKKYINREK